METMKKSRKFLSGFANNDIIDDIYVSDIQKLRPGTIISENENQYKIELGIPYMDRKDIKVTVEEDKLIIDGEKPTGISQSTRKRKYKGIFELPADVLVRDLEVNFEQDLLSVILPKQRIVKQFQSSRNV